MEGTLLDGIFLGMRLRSDEILIGTASGLIKTRTLRRRVEENNGTMNSPGPSKENLDNLFLGSTATTFLQQQTISDRAGVHLEEDQADARLGQQDEGSDPPEAREVSMPPDRLVTQVTFGYVEENVRHERFGKEVRSNTWMSRMCHDWQSSLGHLQGQDAHRTGEE